MGTHAVPDEAALDALVLRMLHLKAPKVFVWLVVLVWFNTNMPLVPRPFQFVEFFAGDGNVANSCRYAMITTAMLDLRKGDALPRKRKRNPFDMTTDSGFVILRCITRPNIFQL